MKQIEITPFIYKWYLIVDTIVFDSNSSDVEHFLHKWLIERGGVSVQPPPLES